VGLENDCDSDILSIPVLVLRCFVNQEVLVETEEQCSSVAQDYDIWYYDHSLLECYAVLA
jgi:hypothetical protein